MAKYSIKAPNGQTYQIDGPDGASDEQVRSEVMRQYPDAGGAAPAQPQAPKEATLGSTLVRAAGNLPGDVVDTAKGVMALPGQAVDALKHPVRTARAAVGAVDDGVDIVTGGIQRARELSKPEFRGSYPAMDTTKYDKFFKGIHDKYGSKQAVYKTVGDHPLAPAITAASIAVPALRATGIGGALADVADAAALKAMPKPKAVPPPQVAELKKTATHLYDEAKNEGVVVNGQAFANFADDIQTHLKNEGVDHTLHPNTTAALNRVRGTNGDPSLGDLEILRRVANDAAGAGEKSDKRLSRILVDKIDDFAENLQPHHVLAGNAPKAVELLGKARETWKNAARGEAIEKLIDKAKFNAGSFGTNLDTAYRGEFKKLANNERGMARFSPKQQAAIRKVAFGSGKLHSTMHLLGRIIPSSQTGVLTNAGVAAAANTLGVPLMGPGGLAIGGAGIGGKVASTMMTAKNAKTASEIARGGSTTAPRSAAYQRILARRNARAAKKP